MCKLRLVLPFGTTGVPRRRIRRWGHSTVHSSCKAYFIILWGGALGDERRAAGQQAVGHAQRPQHTLARVPQAQQRAGVVRGAGGAGRRAQPEFGRPGAAVAPR
eukprot:5137854-Pyramimonas_sp.AAC.2